MKYTTSAKWKIITGKNEILRISIKRKGHPVHTELSHIVGKVGVNHDDGRAVFDIVPAQGRDDSVGPERYVWADCWRLQVAQNEPFFRPADLMQHNPESPAEFIAEKISNGIYCGY